MQIIDPPIGRYSTLEDVRNWIKELEAMPPSPVRDYELASARELLEVHERKSEER